jgi:glutamine synthetase
MATPTDFFDFAKKRGAEMGYLKFVDLLGAWQHCSFPMDILPPLPSEHGRI